MWGRWWFPDSLKAGGVSPVGCPWYVSCECIKSPAEWPGGCVCASPNDVGVHWDSLISAVFRVICLWIVTPCSTRGANLTKFDQRQDSDFFILVSPPLVNCSWKLFVIAECCSGLLEEQGGNRAAFQALGAAGRSRAKLCSRQGAPEKHPGAALQEFLRAPPPQFHPLNTRRAAFRCFKS